MIRIKRTKKNLFLGYFMRFFISWKGYIFGYILDIAFRSRQFICVQSFYSILKDLNEIKTRSHYPSFL